MHVLCTTTESCTPICRACPQVLRPEAGHQGDLALAGVGPDQPQQADLVRGEQGHRRAQGKRGEPPFSMDANLLHISYEG